MAGFHVATEVGSDPQIALPRNCERVYDALRRGTCATEAKSPEAAPIETGETVVCSEP